MWPTRSGDRPVDRSGCPRRLRRLRRFARREVCAIGVRGTAGHSARVFGSSAPPSAQGVGPPLEHARHTRFRTTIPGIPAIVDGSEAVAHVESRLAEVACVYPITPSTTMAAIYQAAVAGGRTDLWGTPLRFIEPESEHSSASAAEGVALSGGRVTNFTAGQGLVLMKEVLYVDRRQAPAGRVQRRRAGDDQSGAQHPRRPRRRDGVADSGWAILFARNAQEAGRPRRHRAADGRGDRDAVHRCPGRLPHDPHGRERAPARGRSSCATTSATRGCTSAT